MGESHVDSRLVAKVMPEITFCIFEMGSGRVTRLMDLTSEGVSKDVYVVSNASASFWFNLTPIGGLLQKLCAKQVSPPWGVIVIWSNSVTRLVFRT